MHDQHISTALELIRHHYEDGGKAPMLLEDPAGWFARKGQQIADLPSNAAEAWENYRNNPVVTAFREQPATMIPGAAKIFGGWAAEHPFAAARKVAGTYADFTGNPTVAIPNAFLSSSPLNEGEDEIARQIEYGIRPENDYPGKERYTMPDNFARGGYASGGNALSDAFTVLKNLATKKIVTNPAERAANLAKFHASSPEEVVNSNWYHGTAREVPNFTNDKPAFVTKNPDFANQFADDYSPKYSQDVAPNVMPLHVRALNPWDHTNPDHVQAVLDRLYEERPLYQAADRMRLTSGDWEQIEKPVYQNPIKELGHDSFFVNEGGNRNLAVYKPANQFKSATGNAGTFDPEIPRLDESRGGHVDSIKYINQLLERLGITPQDALDVLKRHYGGRPK